MDIKDDLENTVRSVERELYAAVRGVPRAFDTRRWMGRLMGWAIRNEYFRTSLFRFIDVLPSLRTDELVVRLVREYFRDDPGTPAFVRRGLGFVQEKGVSSRLAGPMIRKSVASIARQFIAGSDHREIIKALETLRGSGAQFTIDLLGEVVVSDREAEAYAERYLKLLDLLQDKFPRAADISLKVSSFYSQLDPVDWDGSIMRSTEILRPVLRKAKDLDSAITVDMEDYHYKGLTIAIFKSLLDEEEFRELPRMGIALQAYLKDTEQDLRELVPWVRARGRRITIRLVKGAYWDYEVVLNRQRDWPVPVFLNKQETDKNFELLTRLLFENSDLVRPAIASHNVGSIAYAMAVADSLGVKRENYEFQMLYGMAEPVRKAVQEKGFLVRVYTPVGDLIPGMAYLVRRLLENTSNTSFLRRSFGEGTNFHEMNNEPAPPDRVTTEEQGSVKGFRNEPLLDFSLAGNREDMKAAVRMAQRGMSGVYPLIIGGKGVRNAQETASRNPARPSEVVGYVSSASTKDCDAAIAEALRAKDPWRKTRPAQRAQYLFKAAEEMRKRRLQLAALEVAEVGKTWKDADGDVAEAIDYLEYYGREMVRLGKPEKLGNYPAEENEYRYVPKGIAVVIAPWNFPLAIATGMTSAAIVAGNCAIFKPSGLSPVIGYKLCDIFGTIGLPPGVLQFLPGPGSEVGEYLVTHPDVDLIAFTGSRDVGLRIVQLAGETRPGQRNVKKVVAELGGKNAVLVDATADLDQAVKAVVESAFGYQGQKCSACSRVIVDTAVYREFCDRLREAVRSIRIGPPEDPSNSMGPMIDQKALDKVRAYIEIGKQEATTLILREATGEGYFAGPAVFTNVKPGSRLAQEEIFGPVLSVMRAENIDEAIALANHSEYALTGGLYSRSPRNIQKVKEEFLVGNLYINRKITGALVGRQPFGGFGMSGVGSKAGGPDYLLQFMNPMTISENTMRRGFAPLLPGII